MDEKAMHMGEKTAFFLPFGDDNALSADAAFATVNKQLAKAEIAITQDDALMLAERRAESLAETERIEFGMPIVTAIAEAIVTSPFLTQDNIANVLAELQSIFYALRDELPVDVPDIEIVEALRNCFDAYEGDVAAVAALPKEEAMAYSEDYLRLSEIEKHEEYRIVDEEGHVYTFDPTGGKDGVGLTYAFDPSEWDYDEQAAGWDDERWSDD